MNQKSAFLIVPVIACALLLAACQTQTTPAVSPSPESMTQTEADSQTAPSASPAAKSMMTADGKEISITPSYQTPGGEEQVGFTLVVDDLGVITDARTQVMAKTPTTEIRQKAFADALPQALKGKKLAELTTVDRVGGSSLTTGAFNKALVQLKAQL